MHFILTFQQKQWKTTYAVFSVFLPHVDKRSVINSNHQRMKHVFQTGKSLIIRLKQAFQLNNSLYEYYYDYIYIIYIFYNHLFLERSYTHEHHL